MSSATAGKILFRVKRLNGAGQLSEPSVREAVEERVKKTLRDLGDKVPAESGICIEKSWIFIEKS